MSDPRLKVLLLVAVLSFGPQTARAQYVSPLECLPPAGQGMWEIAATNLARAYRTDPTAENKEKMCFRFRSTIEVYANAVEGCRRSTCKDDSFRKRCATVREKVVFWQKRTTDEC